MQKILGLTGSVILVSAFALAPAVQAAAPTAPVSVTISKPATSYNGKAVALHVSAKPVGQVHIDRTQIDTSGTVHAGSGATLHAGTYRVSAHITYRRYSVTHSKHKVTFTRAGSYRHGTCTVTGTDSYDLPDGTCTNPAYPGQKAADDIYAPYDGVNGQHYSADSVYFHAQKVTETRTVTTHHYGATHHYFSATHTVTIKNGGVRLCGAPANPYGYNFCSGPLIYSPASGVCSYFSYIPNFFNGNGYMTECYDGEYSMSGGIRGACSYHGGEYRAVYK